jgi:flagellin-like hook-associated protein FlgL
MQAGATFSFSMTLGVVDAGSVRYIPDSNGGRPPTVEELAQLNALNAGGALAAGSLSEFGLTLGGALGGTGTVTLTVPPATAQIQDEFTPADGTPPVVTMDTITAYSKNELRQCIPGAGAIVISGELVQDGQAIITSTSRVREMDLDLQLQLDVGASIGARSNRADANLKALDKDVVNFRALMSRMEDLDVPSALVDLNDRENIYKSALAVGARVIEPTLMDFLR